MGGTRTRHPDDRDWGRPGWLPDERCGLPCRCVDVAAGFATHSGWAIAVAAGLANGHLRVYDRRRVELISPELPRQAYHAAADLDPAEAGELVAAVETSIVDRAIQAVHDIRDAVGDHSLVALGVVGRAREIPGVAAVLSSHALMHASEGEQYRRGIVDAAARLGLLVYRADPKRIAAEVTETVGWSTSRLTEEQVIVRAAMGPPWQKDHKEASAVALIALESASTQPNLPTNVQ